MSRCHETYRRCASVALVLAIVLIALPSLLNAQTAPKASSAQSDDAVPKAELFIGYQWLNPGGNIPDQNTPPGAFRLPSVAQGFCCLFNRGVAFGGDVGRRLIHFRARRQHQRGDPLETRDSDAGGRPQPHRHSCRQERDCAGPFRPRNQAEARLSAHFFFGAGVGAGVGGSRFCRLGSIFTA